MASTNERPGRITQGARFKETGSGAVIASANRTYYMQTIAQQVVYWAGVGKKQL